MKKQMKKMLSMILALAMILTLTNGYHSKVVKAAVKTQCTTYNGNNIGAQDYTGKQSNYYPGPMKSYLVAQKDGTFMRVQYGSQIEGLLVEYYDKDYNITDTKMIQQELPIFGGFYATDSNYYVVTGQKNTEENNNVEVYRITKYDKQWNRVDTASLKGANTTTPFDAGSCRMDMSGKYLLIRTCHEMYKYTDGKIHQANVTIQIDTDTMNVTDSHTKISNINEGYLSHSFNQFIKVEDGHIISVDHGDANPRSIILLKYQTDMSEGKFTPDYYQTPCIQVPVLEFKYLKDKDHKNPTGASVGGFEISDDHYLVAGNNVKLDENFDSYNTRNIFVAAVDKSTSEVKTTYLTNYNEGEETTTTPQLVKISGTRFMVLWTKGDQVYYTLVNNKGEKIGEIHNFKGNLSDCHPVVSGNKVVWYIWKNEEVVFYDINTNNLSDHNVTEIHNGHQYVYDPSADTADTITFKCSQCGITKTEKKITIQEIYWKNSEEQGNTYRWKNGGWNQKVGTTMTSMIEYTPTDSNINTELDIISSNEDVISVLKVNGTRIQLIASKAGTSMITIKPKYNPQNVYTYKVTAYDPLKLTSFETTNKTPQLDEKVILSAKTQGGAGTLQYRFYEKDSEGKETTIQKYSNKATCEWTPSTLGKRTLYVEVKDAEKNVEQKTIENVTVIKKRAPKINDLEKSYCYTIGADNQKIDLNDYLPEDIKNLTYEAKITNPSRKIVTEANKENKTYSYNVSKDGQVGDQAKIQFTVQSDNYEDIIFNVNIALSDKLTVTPKTGNEPAIEGSNELTYGQKLSALKLNTSEAKFIAEDGTEVTGTLKFSEPDKIPEAGTKTAQYTFTPDKAQYKTYTGTVAISVQKATPKLSEVTVDDTLFASGKCFKDLTIHPGKAIVNYDGGEKEIQGSWTFENPEKKLDLGTNQVIIVFIPEDTNNYEKVQKTINIVANIKFQVSKTEAVCGDTIELKIDPETVNPKYNDTYRFYYVNEDGQEITIQNSSETEYKWIPTKSGKYTLYAEIQGSSCKAKVENVNIKKAKANKIEDTTKEYPYTTGYELEEINLKELLPDDIKIRDKRAEIQDLNHILNFGAFYGDNTYKYSLNRSGSIGDTATIQFTIKSDNYEDITFTRTIKLRDQIEIEPKEPLTKDIFNKDSLTYGEMISNLAFKSRRISVETKEAGTLSGTLEFKNPDDMPDVGLQKVEYIFTPDNEKYKAYVGTIEVNVKKQKPTLTSAYFKTSKYDPQKMIKDAKLVKIALVWLGDHNDSVSGTWKIKNEDQKLPLGKSTVEVEFTPDDIMHYETVIDTFNIETLIELKTDLQSKEAKVGDKIQVSADPKAENLQCKFYLKDTNGNVETIRDYASDAECEWIPDKEGTYTVYVEAKDEAGNIATAHTEEITVNKKEEVTPPKKDPQQENPGSAEQQPTTEDPNKQQPTIEKPENSTSIKQDMAANVNGVSYKVTKIENAKNAQVTITSLDKKKSAIVIPDYITINGVKCKVVTIKKKAVYKRTKLKKLTIGKNVQTIEDNAFKGCKNLKSITIKSTVLKKVGKNAIKGIHKKAVIKVPKKQYKKYKKLFGKKSGFKKPMRLKK